MKLQKNKNILFRVLRICDSYWFSHAPVLDLEICRIVIVAVLIINLILGNYFDWAFNSYLLFYNDYKINSVLLIPYVLWWIASVNSVPNFTLFLVCFWITLLSGISSLVGFKTKISLVIFTIGNIALRGYVYLFRGKPFHPDAVIIICLVIITLSFTLSSAEIIMSIDNLKLRLKHSLKKRKFKYFNNITYKMSFARWPILLMQWIIAITYFDAAISKLMKDSSVSLLANGNSLSLDWLNGYSLQKSLLGLITLEGGEIGYWLGQHHTLAVIASWITVIFEGTFFLVLIFPQLVWLYIPMGIFFHLGIYITMKIPFFMIIATYVVFIPWTAVIKNLSSPKSTLP
jgi:hypothetical protein